MLLQRLPVSQVAVTTLLVTLIAVFAGVLILNDPFKCLDLEVDKVSDGDKMAKWGSIMGYCAAGILLLRIFLDVGMEFISAIACIACMLWPVLAFGFVAAILAIVFGIIALVKGTSEGMKTKAFIALGLGIGYFIVGIIWAIVSLIIF